MASQNLIENNDGSGLNPMYGRITCGFWISPITEAERAAEALHDARLIVAAAERGETEIGIQHLTLNVVTWFRLTDDRISNARALIASVRAA